MITLPAPSLEHLCNLEVVVGAPVEVGLTPQGLRRMIPIEGGTVSGPHLNGHIVPGGADFQLIVSEGMVAHLDARYVIELDDQSRVFVSNRALRVASAEDSARLRRGEPVAPENVYFRCQPSLEAVDEKWHWLNNCQVIGSGQRTPDRVLLSFYRVL